LEDQDHLTRQFGWLLRNIRGPVQNVIHQCLPTR
jgi:hypothetical protein